MKFAIYTFGCKVNTYESEMMREKLLSNHYVLDPENPDVVIVNTCAVTNVADRKSLDFVKKIRSQFPHVVLVVCGCSVQEHPTLYQEKDITILLGNKDKSQIVTLLDHYFAHSKKITAIPTTRDLPFENMEVEKFQTHTRAFVKIQDGCNNFCSYCIIPYVRGVPRSKEYDLVYKEVCTLVQNGHHEIVLTGIHTGSYFDLEGHDLTDLIHGISQIENLKRIRISSIEVNELNDKFLEELKRNSKICDHFHIPLQAGSNEILEKMHRKYDLGFFKERVEKIRLIRPQVSITTDIIVGHPYETDELFLQTLSFAREIAFSKIHVFPYSKKEGTLSSKMPYQVDDVVKKKRTKELCNLSKELESSFAKKFIHESLEILILRSDEVSSGLSSNYLTVKIAQKIPTNTFVKVFITSFDGQFLWGEVSE